MELKWLEDFVCLASARSFWKASEERNVSQPAFSRRIRTLENWLGVTLIDRSSYPVSLTPYGKQFLPYAQEILKTSRTVREEFRMLAGAQANELRIATQHSISIYLLPRFVRAFFTRQPNAKLVVIPTLQGIEHHFDALANGVVHVLVTYAEDAITANLADADAFEEKAVAQDELVPVASAEFAKKHAIKDLKEGGAALPLLAYAGFSFSERLVSPVVRSLGKRLKPVYENSLSDGLKAMALQDCGVAWLPRNSIAAELERGALVAVGDESLAVPVKIAAYRLRSSTSPALNAFWAVL